MTVDWPTSDASVLGSQPPGPGYGCSTSSALMVIRTLSPTTTPGPSPGNSQRSPKSFRLTVVVASMPRRMPPAWLNGGEAETAKVTGLETPCIVKLPVTEYDVALDRLTPVEAKVMVGYLAASKNSGPLRCVSRSSTPVVIELT